MSAMPFALALTLAGQDALPLLAAPPPRVLEDSAWIAPPRPQYPIRALERSVAEGAVVLVCIVAAEGGLTRCAVLLETPLGAGFGPAAMRATAEARARPDLEGQSVRFTVHFKLAE